MIVKKFAVCGKIKPHSRRDDNCRSLMAYEDKKAVGEVKITSVTADTVSGEVDLIESDKSIKGTFTAKLRAANK